MVLTLKPVSSACNMRCSYCYYVEKFTSERDQHALRHMSVETLETAIRKYAQALPLDQELHFLWHGGEPMIMPLDFYRKAIRLQKEYSKGRKILNSLQTNGTLITQEWADFLAAEGWLLGVSIDGQPEMNDANRRLRNGDLSTERVLRNISVLNKSGVEWNVMATVNRTNVAHPEEFYDFLKCLGTRFIQFTPIAERRHSGKSLSQPNETGNLTSESITPTEWGSFLCRIFDRWLKQDVGKVFVQLFDATLAGYLGASPGTCIFSPKCGKNPVVEANGDIYCCDHYVFEDYKIGNVHRDDFNEISVKIEDFVEAKQSKLPAECKTCRFLNICNGECPKNRFKIKDTDKQMSNYLCSGYQRYFRHTESFMLNARDNIIRHYKGGKNI